MKSRGTLGLTAARDPIRSVVRLRTPNREVVAVAAIFCAWGQGRAYTLKHLNPNPKPQPLMFELLQKDTLSQVLQTTHSGLS